MQRTFCLSKLDQIFFIQYFDYRHKMQNDIFRPYIYCDLLVKRNKKKIRSLSESQHRPVGEKNGLGFYHFKKNSTADDLKFS